MTRTSIVSVGLIVSVVAIAALFTSRSEAPREPVVASTAAGLETRVFHVEHMTCATCPITVKAAMAAVTGVSAVEVDFESKTARVTFDPAIATPEQIAAASTNAGYPASPAS
ncbi:MAG: heavy metal-associated domain-containing protein [Acidobacteriota bacterium]